jgi:hypothetical protein
MRLIAVVGARIAVALPLLLAATTSPPVLAIESDGDVGKSSAAAPDSSPLATAAVTDTNAAAALNPIDHTAPIITPNVVGRSGSAGWYVSNVEVTWAVIDPEGPIESRTGCDRVDVIDDTQGVTLTCRATSSGGTASRSATIRKDSSPPAVALSVPAAGVGFYTGQVVRADFQCTDAGSGVASCNGSVPVGVYIDTVLIGENIFEVKSSDQAGNAQSVTGAYIVVKGRRTCGGPRFGQRWPKD